LIAAVFASGANNSVDTAAVRGISSNLIRIIHPFHPFTGRQLHYVGVRYNRYGKRLLLRADALTICSVPPQWTDTVAVDPEVVLGEGRTLIRVADLLRLAELVERLAAERRAKQRGEV
jgi:hypothetical protein